MACLLEISTRTDNLTFPASNVPIHSMRNEIVLHLEIFRSVALSFIHQDGLICSLEQMYQRCCNEGRPERP